MARKKINSGYETKTKALEKRMLKYFPPDYTYFFQKPLCGMNDYANRNNYIPNESMEQQLDAFWNFEKNILSILIGYNGMGKSTILKNYIDVQSSDELSITEKEVLFSKFDWNYNHLKQNAYSLSHIIHNINSRLCTHYNIAFKNEEESFFSFLMKMDPDLVSIDCSFSNSLSEIKDKYTEIYEIRKLQFLLQNYKIRQFTIVIDNIECLNLDRRYGFLSKLVECFRLLTESPSEKTIIKMLFAFRPSTLYEAQQHGCFGNRKIDLYIKQQDTINLEKFFGLKLKNYNKDSDFFESWFKCRPLFIKVSQKYNRKYDQIIKKLCNYSVPASMRLYGNILSNARWMHDTKSDFYENEQEHFNIDDIVVNNITVIRAIACLEDEMFVPKTPSSEYMLQNLFSSHKSARNAMPICNLLYSTQTTDYSILILYIIKFFYNYCKKDNFYGSTYLKCWDIVKIFTETFYGIDNIAEKVSACISYLFDMQILDKSIKTKQGEKSGLNSESRLYLTPKGEIMWEMLSWDSVLLEIFREDYYRDYSPGGSNNSLCSYVLMNAGKQCEIFNDLIRMIGDLLETERIYRKQAKNNDTITSLKENLGENCVCFQLFEGLKQSMSYSGLIKKVNENFYLLEKEIAAVSSL